MTSSGTDISSIATVVPYELSVRIVNGTFARLVVIISICSVLASLSMVHRHVAGLGVIHWARSAAAHPQLTQTAEAG